MNYDEVLHLLAQTTITSLHYCKPIDNEFRLPTHFQYSREIKQHWDYDKPCSNCGCIYLKSIKQKQRQKCCIGGKAVILENYPKLQPLPSNIMHIATKYINHFSRNSVSYNSVLALGAIGVDNGCGGGWEKIHGDHSLRLHGRTYHYLNNTSKTNGLKYFTFDALAEAQNHGNQLNENTERCNSHFLELIFRDLQTHNKVVQECEQIGKMAKSDMNTYSSRNVIATINSQTSYLDVAAITAENTTGNAVIHYKRKDSENTTTISCTDPLQEPLIYPILFSHGEKGWNTTLSKIHKISFQDYLCSRILMPERDDDNNILKINNHNNTKLLPISRFQLIARLGQTYLVDQLSRAIDYRLLWHQHNQRNILGDNAFDNQTEGESFLRQSFHGSRRHLRSLAHNALCIVSEYGKPVSIHYTYM